MILRKKSCSEVSAKFFLWRGRVPWILHSCSLGQCRSRGPAGKTSPGATANGKDLLTRPQRPLGPCLSKAMARFAFCGTAGSSCSASEQPDLISEDNSHALEWPWPGCLEQLEDHLWELMVQVWKVNSTWLCPTQPRGHRWANFIPRLPRKTYKAGNVYIPQGQGETLSNSPDFILGI